MAVFDYDESFQQAEYYELLNVLMERWETEIVAFKEATIRMVCVRRQRGTHEASCWNIF